VGKDLRHEGWTKDLNKRKYLSKPYNKKNGLKKVLIYSIENKDIILGTA